MSRLHKWIAMFALAALLLCGCADKDGIGVYADEAVAAVSAGEDVAAVCADEDVAADASGSGSVYAESAVRMEPVESSCFSEVGYDAYAEALYVRFLESGSLYRYSEFPAEEYGPFMSAGSLGSYYNAHIKGQYPCERIE